MPLDAHTPAASLSHPFGSRGAPVGPARAAVAHLLRDEAAVLPRLRRAAVYLPGVLGAPRLFATSTIVLGDHDPLEATNEPAPNPLRLAAVRAASGPGAGPFVLELQAERGEPHGAVLVIPMEGAGWLVAQRDEGWPLEERGRAQALARSIHRVLVGSR